MLDVTDAKFPKQVQESLQSVIDAACNHRAQRTEYFQAIAAAVHELDKASSQVLTNLQVSPRHITYIILIF